MAQYFIVNRSVKGIVTIDKESLDFQERGWASTENEATYNAAKNLKSLGYEALTAEEMKAKYVDPANQHNQNSKQPANTQDSKPLTSEEKLALQKELADVKKAWDSEEDANKKALLAAKIEDITKKLK